MLAFCTPALLPATHYQAQELLGMFGLVEVPQDGKAGTGGTGKKPGVVPETLKPPPAARILAKQSTSGILAKPSTSGGEKQAAWKGTWGRLGEAATANARACVFVCVCVYIYLYIYTPEYSLARSLSLSLALSLSLSLSEESCEHQKQSCRMCWMCWMCWILSV